MPMALKVTAAERPDEVPGDKSEVGEAESTPVVKAFGVGRFRASRLGQPDAFRI